MNDSRNRQTSSHQPDSLSGRFIGIVGVSLLGLVMAVMAILYFSLEFFLVKNSMVSPQSQWQVGETSPGVQPNQAFDYQQLLAKQNEQLDSYGWQDQRHTIARIPIERAMRSLAKDSEPEDSEPKDREPEEQP